MKNTMARYSGSHMSCHLFRMVSQENYKLVINIDYMVNCKSVYASIEALYQKWIPKIEWISFYDKICLTSLRP